MNSIHSNTLQKAGILVCLFLCSAFAKAQEWTFDAHTQQAYDLVLNLALADAHQLISKPETPQEHYVTALAEAMELLIGEDGEKYAIYEERFEQRLERKTKQSNADDMFLQAEINLQWAFVYLKFGHEFDAALHFRNAYTITQEVKKRFPAYQAIKKTAGLLDVIIGSIPEKYNWVLGLLNMQGTVNVGLEDFNSIRRSAHPLAKEANLLYALTEGYVLQNTSMAIAEVNTHLEEDPHNKLSLFLGSALSIKNSNSEQALQFLLALQDQPKDFPIHYVDYLRGEVYLHKGEYLNAMSAYRSFVNHFKGDNHLKDSYYKIGLCYWLNGNKNDALNTFKEARSIGKEASEADKYAAKSLADKELPHIALTKARYATDGGYYNMASKTLAQITQEDIKTQRDEVEFYYRKARLAHKQNDLPQAIEFYEETIKSNGSSEWYFAPNACLQLGYIALSNHEEETAKTYFTRALSYKKHEYKNSIDSKAKSALAHLSASK